MGEVVRDHLAHGHVPLADRPGLPFLGAHPVQQFPGGGLGGRAGLAAGAPPGVGVAGQFDDGHPHAAGVVFEHAAVAAGPPAAHRVRPSLSTAVQRALQ